MSTLSTIERVHTAATSLSRHPKDILLGDGNLWVPIDFVISPPVDALPAKMDEALEQAFKNGELDAHNGSFFDAVIEHTCEIALSNLNSQKAESPENLKSFEHWRIRDECELREQLQMHLERIEEEQNEFNRCKAKLEELNTRKSKKRRRDKNDFDKEK